MNIKSFGILGFDGGKCIDLIDVLSTLKLTVCKYQTYN